MSKKNITKKVVEAVKVGSKIEVGDVTHEVLAIDDRTPKNPLYSVKSLGDEKRGTFSQQFRAFDVNRRFELGVKIDGKAIT